MPARARSMDEIEQQLADSIDWNRARVKFLARFLVALISVKTVCLTQIASVFPGPAQAASAYKRIQRFLRDFDLDWTALARLLVQLSGASGPFVLALDRTNWKLGRVHLNVLMLVLVHRGVGIPLFWKVLGKAGNSHTRERIALLERFVATFGRASIAMVCADREFASAGLLDWLIQQRVGFRLRLKGDVLVTNAKGQPTPVWRFFQSCRVGEERALGWRGCLGQRVYLTGTRLAGDGLIVLSDRPAPLSEYALRWPIETLFGCLKSRGFCLEATHVTEAERLAKLLGLLAIAFVWALAAGGEQESERPTAIKKHGRRARSLFRLGLDWLRRVLAPLAGRYTPDDFHRALRFLSCT